jgi:hypothetical protein
VARGDRVVDDAVRAGRLAARMGVGGLGHR